MVQQPRNWGDWLTTKVLKKYIFSRFPLFFNIFILLLY